MTDAGGPRPLFNPASGEAIGVVREDSPAALREAVIAARAAQAAWAALPFAERGRHLLAVRDFVVREADRIAAGIAACTGKTRVDALSTEVLPAALAADYYARKTGRLLRRERLHRGSVLTANKVSHIDRVPWGVVGVISPWNYPFAIPFSEIVMALMAGNAVVVKVATQTQAVGDLLAEAMAAGHLPPGLFAQVDLPGSVAGEAFVASGIDKLFFTGSVAVGKALMAQAAGRLLPVSLELGGNDAMIVCDDANLERAVEGALWAGFSNCGQSCGGVERVFVEPGIYDAFTARLRERTRALRQGEDRAFDVDIGALTSRDQLETVRRHVRDALEKGARITAESPVAREGGLFHPAVVLEDVSDAMTVMREEIFGPVLAVARVRNLDEAVARANDSALGLTASVWTRDRAKGRAVAARLQAGVVTINDHLMSHGLPETPWGGFKASGLGRTHGRLGLEEMTQPRVVVDDRLSGLKRNLWWYPSGPTVYDGLKGALAALYGGGPAARLRGLAALARLFLKTLR